MSLSDEIRARHKQSGYDRCCECHWQQWPCDAIRAAEELDRLTAVLNVARLVVPQLDGEYIDGNLLQDRIEDYDRLVREGKE